jgi:hypothetical protein
MNEKTRRVGDLGYKVIHAVEIGDREIVAASNMDAPESQRYMVADYTSGTLIGEYSGAVMSADYSVIMRKFTERINRQLEAVKEEIAKTDFQPEIITEEQCIPREKCGNLTGKVAAVNPKYLRPEYCRGDQQLVLVTGGFGAKYEARGHAVYCRHLNDGKAVRYENHQIMGEVKELPDWAKKRLETVKAENEAAPPQEREVIAGYEIIARLEVGEKCFILGHDTKAVSPYVTWQRFEGRSGYDLGHYFSDYYKAINDLHARADKERGDSDKTRKSKNRNDAR